MSHLGNTWSNIRYIQFSKSVQCLFDSLAFFTVFVDIIVAHMA